MKTSTYIVLTTYYQVSQIVSLYSEKAPEFFEEETAGLAEHPANQVRNADDNMN